MPILYRYHNCPTRGLIIHENRILCHTLELPWWNNSRNISCIPEGHYDVHKSLSSKHGSCFRFASVPNRTGILIHKGNTLADTQGCILVGLDTNARSLLHSSDAMKRLLFELPQSFKLHIRNI